MDKGVGDEAVKLKFRDKKICPLCNKKEIWSKSPNCRSCANKKRPPTVFSKEARIKISNSLKGKTKGLKKGKDNPMWKGNDPIHITTLHQWLRTNYPKPETCVKCGEKPSLDLANKNGNYVRDINEFEWLCRRCHMISDGRMNNLKRGRERRHNA